MNSYNFWKVVGYIALGASAGASVLLAIAQGKTTKMDNQREIAEQIKKLGNSN